MRSNIDQLIDIYENELADLLQQHYNGGSGLPLSRTPIPTIGSNIQLGGQQFTVTGIGNFLDAAQPTAPDDFLNNEDRKIIHELEKEGDDEDDTDQDGEFDDDPYPDPVPNNIWGMDIDGDEIDLPEREAEYKNDAAAVKTMRRSDDRETTIAFYKSFHSSGPAFGIYYKRKGLKRKTRTIHRFCTQRGYGMSLTECYTIAKVMTQFHEIYHHKIEAMASRIEVISRVPVYNNGFSAWYQRTRRRAKCYEETFANCYAYQKTINALQRIFPAAVLHNIMVYWFNLQPIPYRNALRLISTSKETQRRSENQFFEMILSKVYPANARFGIRHSRVWNLFTHGSQPYITTNSNVYYII